MQVHVQTIHPILRYPNPTYIYEYIRRVTAHSTCPGDGPGDSGDHREVSSRDTRHAPQRKHGRKSRRPPLASGEASASAHFSCCKRTAVQGKGEFLQAALIMCPSVVNLKSGELPRRIVEVRTQLAGRWELHIPRHTHPVSQIVEASLDGFLRSGIE